ELGLRKYVPMPRGGGGRRGRGIVGEHPRACQSPCEGAEWLFFLGNQPWGPAPKSPHGWPRPRPRCCAGPTSFAPRRPIRLVGHAGGAANRLRHVHATVDVQGLTRDVARLRRGEKENRGGNVR